MLKKPTYFRWLAGLLVMAFIMLGSNQADAQCIAGGSWGGATLNGVASPVSITACNYAGEYSPLTVTVDAVGVEYRFTATGGVGNYLTLTDGSNNPIVWGASPLEFTFLAAGSYRIHVHTTDVCGTDFSCHAISASIVVPPPANDLCADAIEISCGDVINASTVASTTTGAPALCGTSLNTAGGVWYKFTGNGLPATVSLCGSSYDTKIGVFEDGCGTLTCVAGNDDFCGLQSEVTFASDNGVEYLVYVTGFSTATGNFTLSLSCVNPGLEFLNPHLAMGDRPIGAWMKPAMFEIVNNPGAGNFVITDAEIDDTADGMLQAVSPALPFTFPSGETTNAFGIGSTDAMTAPAAFSGTFALIYQSQAAALITATYSGNTYTPVPGDVWESALNIAAFPFAAAAVATAPFYDVYDLPGVTADNKDVVYIFSVATDRLLSAALTGADAKIALYASDFDGVGGPDADNDLVSGTTTITDFQLYAGTYFLVVSTSSATYDLTVNAPLMPAPVAATYVAPADGAVNITNGDMLEWTFGDFTDEYQVVLGTTYPPATVVVPFTSNLATSYTLVDVNPNLQYFWQVNVRNSQGTTPGAIWGFTTTIDVPTGLAATVVDPAPSAPTVSANLSWTAIPNRAFLGYNVYRDGVQINVDPISDASYTDLGLARNTTYDYNVTALFDEGESAFSNTATITTKGVGTINGFVFDALSLDPIEGASVTIAGTGGTYPLTTAANGGYSTLAYAGSYSVGVSASGYTSQTIGGQVLAHAATLTVPAFYMMEVPYPVGDVTAFELNSDAVQVSWDGSGPTPPPLVEEWLFYDNGVFSGSNWWVGAGVPFSWGVNFLPEDMEDLEGTLISKVVVYQTWSTDVNVLNIYSGDHENGTATLLYSQSLTGLVNEAYNEVDLAIPVPFDHTQELWVTLFAPNPTGGVAGGALGGPHENANWINWTGTWVHVSDFGFDDIWPIRAFVSNASNRSQVELRRFEDNVKYDVNSQANLVAMQSEPGTVAYKSVTPERGVVDYDVWREKVYMPGALEQIGSTSQMNFVDFDWGIMDWGVYRWAVTVNYEGGQVSPPSYSNTLDKDMYTEVDVTVTTNSGDSPAGTLVMFTNTSELDNMGEPIYIYDVTLGGSGMYAWDQFRKGTYDWEVFLPGYALQSGVIDIFDETSLEFLLMEVLASPANLYVTPTGLATWEAGFGAPFAPYFEDFDAGLPADWTVELGPNAVEPDLWFLATPTGAQPFTNTPYMRADSDAAGFGSGRVHTILYSPVIDASGTAGLYVEFDQYYQHLGASSYGNVEVFDGSDWVVVLNQTITSGSWTVPNHQILDVTAYANANFQVRFNYDDGGAWAWRWSVDNFVVNEVASRTANRALEGFKVFLDGVLVAETEEQFHQYAVANLVDGDTYYTEVAAVYSTGQSAPADFTWTYIACDNYATPGDFAAAQVIGTLDVALSWTIPTIDPLEDQIDFARIYRDGEVLAEIAVPDAMYLDEELEFGEYVYCITFVYESGAETCPGEICETVEVTGGAFVDGMVVQAAYLGGAPVEGALVWIYNDDASFEFLTDADGMYDGEVLAGTYNYEVSAPGYITEMLAGIAIPEASTVTQNFVLMEFPEAVRDVVAVELTDNTVEISWRTPGYIPFEPFIEDFSGGIAAWTKVPDAVNWQSSATSLAGGAAPEVRFYWSPSAVSTWSFISPMMSTLTQSELELTFKHFLSHFSGPYTLQLKTIADGQEYLVHEWVNPTGWTAQTFTTMLTADHGVGAEEFQIVFVFTGDSFNVNNWNIDDIMLYTPGTLALGANNEYMMLRTPESTLQGYSVYRTSCEAGGDLQFLGFTLDSIFNDNTWGTAAAGVYMWGVEAVYAENLAEVIFSNCLDKDMVTTVSVTVSTNSGDLPTGTDVIFMNTSEPDLELVYEVELDETGFFVWDDFRKGTYDVYVELAGFAPVELFDVVIDGPTNFVWVLEELLLPVSDLYVTPTGYATWSSGGELGFQPYFEDFESGDGGWISGAVSGADHWEYGTPAQANLNGAYSGTKAWATRLTANYDNNANTYLMRQFDFSDVAEPFFSVQLLLYSEPGWDGMILEYSLDDGGSWAKIVGDAGFYNNTSTFGPLAPPKWSGRIGVYQLFESSMPEVALESNVWLRFRFQSDGSVQDQGVAIDDIMIVDGVPARALEYYKVWHHGLFVADTENEFFQYDAEELGLVEGETYLAEVAAMYSNGMSAKMSYEWTFYGCENFNGPDALTAEVVNNENVVLNWSGEVPPPPPGGDLYEISYHNGVPSNAFFQVYNNGYGVVYNLSGYNNVTVEMIDYRHSPWGVFGTWDYKIHIVDWDTYTLIETTDVMQTTLDNGWELEVPLGSIPESGLVGIFLEPMSNSAADAYPCLDGDQAATSNSFYGPLPNWAGMTNAGTVGNFLIDLWIMAEPVTGGPREMVKAPKLEAPAATSMAQVKGPRPVEATQGTRDASDYAPYQTAYDDKPSRDLYDLLYSFPVGVGGGEYSVATDGDFIYTAAWNSANFYKYELDGTYIGPFTIAGAGNLRDLTYDGEFFYGSPNSTTIYKMDFTNGTLEGTISAPSAVRGIAYDEDNDGFWVTNGWDGPLRLISRTGTVLQTLNTAAASYSGLAYDNASDGGPFLWGHNQPASNNILTKIDITTGATLETFDVATVAPVGAGISGGMTITNQLVEDTWTFLGTAQNEVIWVIELAEDGSGGGGGGGGGGGFEWEYLGANVYRNGELIAELVQGETYTDQEVLPGDYTYCVTFVYDLGAESCFGDPCVDVEVTCESPVDLTGTYEWNYNNGNPEFGALIGWSSATAPVAEWLFYDDGTNVDGIGGPATFTWAIKFDPAQLADFEGASLTKIQIYNRLASTDELRIYEGTNAATLLHTQQLAGLAMEAWAEVDLTSAVALDITKQLWIAVYTTDGVNFPAGCGAGQNQPNGDLITLDGVLWEHLTDYGLIYTWNLRGFVTTAAGATVALPMDKPVDNYNVSERSLLSASGKVSTANNVADLNAGRSLEGYNVYRSTDNVAFELIATVDHDPTVASFEYFDMDVDAGEGYYYQVTAIHDFVEVICESYPAFALLEPENDYVYVLVTSIEDVNATATRLYPNPANLSLNIEAPSLERITVMNAIGQVVYDVEVTGDRQQLNTSSYEAGVYMIRLTTAEGMVTKRVTIVR